MEIGGSPDLPVVAEDITPVNSSGGVHVHPVWELIGDGGVPLDGAYLFELKMDSNLYEASDAHGLLFHKGLDAATYELAVDRARDALCAVGPPKVIPTPAALPAGLAPLRLMGRRRRLRS